MLEANFWQNKVNSKNIIKEKKLYEDLINSFNSSVEKLKDLNDLNQLAIDENNQIVQKEILQNLKESDFAVTDLSHSRAIIQMEGQEVKEVLKKGCPFNFNSLEKDNSINSIYNGIAFTVDLLKTNPDKVRLFTLRSFGESLYHSITDASLEFGFKTL